jgi:hypothetical protein
MCIPKAMGTRQHCFACSGGIGGLPACILASPEHMYAEARRDTREHWLPVQAAVVACQLVVHARRVPDMGFLPAAEFEAAVRAHAMWLPYLPALGAETVFLRSGYQVLPPILALPVSQLQRRGVSLKRRKNAKKNFFDVLHWLGKHRKHMENKEYSTLRQGTKQILVHVL